MSTYTNLPLSRKIASLGVECESAYFWAECLFNETENGKTTSHWMLYRKIKGGDDVAISDFPEWFDGEDFDWRQEVDCFTLGELPPVLQAIGAVKGWGKTAVTETPILELYWYDVCRLYLDSPEKAWKYLSDLLDNN